MSSFSLLVVILFLVNYCSGQWNQLWSGIYSETSQWGISDLYICVDEDNNFTAHYAGFGIVLLLLLVVLLL